MVKLVVKNDNKVVSEVSGQDGDAIRIGRKGNCDLVLKHPAISSLHAIVHVGAVTYIEDKGSTNGSFINGKRVTKTLILDRDKIDMGPFVLEYHAELAPMDDAEEMADSIDKTMIFSSSAISKAAVPGILTLSGEETGEVINLDQPFVSIGRSGRHAALVMRQPNGFSISLIRSSSPTPGEIPSANGNPLDISGVLLNDQDLISVDGVMLKFYTDVTSIRTGQMKVASGLQAPEAGQAST